MDRGAEQADDDAVGQGHDQPAHQPDDDAVGQGHDQPGHQPQRAVEPAHIERPPPMNPLEAINVEAVKDRLICSAILILLPIVLLGCNKVLSNPTVLWFYGMLATVLFVDHVVVEQGKRILNGSINIPLLALCGTFSIIFTSLFITQQDPMGFYNVFSMLNWSANDDDNKSLLRVLWLTQSIIGLTNVAVTKSLVVLTMPFARSGALWRRQSRCLGFAIASLNLYTRVAESKEFVLYFTLTLYDGFHVLGLASALIYVLFSRKEIDIAYNQLKFRWELLFRREPLYGITPTREYLEARNQTNCGVCLDTLNSPIQLNRCGHVFCDDCINNVFNYYTTCPECRAQIVSSPAFGQRSIISVLIPLCRAYFIWLQSL